MANGQLDKAAKCAMATLVDKDGEFAAAELLGHFEVVHFRRAIGQSVARIRRHSVKIIAGDCADHGARMSDRDARGNAPPLTSPRPQDSRGVQKRCAGCIA
jgi:hypothetical protein